jgi:hypothetical protein
VGIVQTRKNGERRGEKMQRAVKKFVAMDLRDCIPVRET